MNWWIFLGFLVTVFYEEKLLCWELETIIKQSCCSQEVCVFSGMKWNVSLIPCRGGSEQKQNVSSFYFWVLYGGWIKLALELHSTCPIGYGVFSLWVFVLIHIWWKRDIKHSSEEIFSWRASSFTGSESSSSYKGDIVIKNLFFHIYIIKKIYNIYNI